MRDCPVPFSVRFGGERAEVQALVTWLCQRWVSNHDSECRGLQCTPQSLQLISVCPPPPFLGLYADNKSQALGEVENLRGPFRPVSLWEKYA